MIKIMNKNAIKKFAIEARQEMISRVSQRAAKYGISDNETGNPMDEIVDGYILSPIEQMQRAALIGEIKEKGYAQVLEEVAYTWFNRFCALRYMEVNGYLPTRIRVFTDENNEFKPQILSEAIHLDLEGLDIKKVYGYKEANETDELYKYLIITQCNALSKVLPGMFQTISDYTELLFPDNILREGSTVSKMIDMIDEEDWKNAVEIIGWLYQYYNSEKKDEVYARMKADKKHGKITKDNIPAATQLFTPDWIVRYMVENSLGRLWLEGHPNEELRSNWIYYLDEAKQDEEVEKQLEEIREEYKKIKPDEIKCIDPCSGSGHILVYMFDLLMEIYQTQGYNTRSAVKSIVENNIYGLDLDDRAAQLTYFSLMMKARQYDRGFLNRGIQPHAYEIKESNNVNKFTIEYFANGDSKLREAIDTIIEELHDAKEYGSILTVTPQDWPLLYNRFVEIEKDTGMSRGRALGELLPLVQVAEALAQKYDVVVTNPPYLGGKNLDTKMLSFLEEQYSTGKYDLYSSFIIRCSFFAKKARYIAMITQQGWMFLPTYEKLRRNMLDYNLVDMAQLGTRAFEEIGGEVVQTTTFVFRKQQIPNYKSVFVRLTDYENEEKEEHFRDINLRYNVSTDLFQKIQGKPMAYWGTEKTYDLFSDKPLLREYVDTKQGLKSSDDKRFFRYWPEVNLKNIEFHAFSQELAESSSKRWFPLNKGGRLKWYGDYWHLINWENDGYEIKEYARKLYRSATRTITSIDYYFKESISWPKITSEPVFRLIPKGFIFSDAGSAMFYESSVRNYLLGFLNTVIVAPLTKMLNPTVNLGVGDMLKIPFILEASKQDSVNEIVDTNIQLSKNDWDSFETSWDFQRHPLLRKVSTIAEAFNQWQAECDDRFKQLKANEEELNRIFIDIYGLQDELTPEVEDKDVTVRKADLERDIKSFIFYAVGCMFGRYSLDVDGLAYAGGDWDESKYSTFKADGDNIIPICDDEYFDDDIVGRFIKFVETVYGKDTLQENLEFIADALGGKGQPKDVIRKYFLDDFYKDHCKIYQKRPIYWMFDSGKKNGFKCLIYMHRYKPDILARIRTDYVHEQQSRYRTSILDLEKRIDDASTSEKVKLNKKLKTLNDQAKEILDYEEKIHHLADQMISIDLDDGVKNNYKIFKDVLAKIK